MQIQRFDSLKLPVFVNRIAKPLIHRSRKISLLNFDTDFGQTQIKDWKRITNSLLDIQNEGDV